jgi:hypothetical protein
MIIDVLLITDMLTERKHLPERVLSYEEGMGQKLISF